MAREFGEMRRGIGAGLSRAKNLAGTGMGRAEHFVRVARARSPAIDHLGRALGRYLDKRGDRLAAALSFYGFLSFFPLVALAYAITGYAASLSSAFRGYLSRAIADLLPGLAGQLPVAQIAGAKAGAGVIALLGLAWAGLGWMGVWREALRTIWSLDPRAGNVAVKKLRDVAVICALALLLLASVAVSSLATSATHAVLETLELDRVGAGAILRVVAIAVAVAVDMVLFFVLFSRLSGTKAPWHRLVRGCLFGAVGFEALKLLGTLLIAHTTRNPVYASFAVTAGLLVWINIVSRFILFAAAWTATRLVVLHADGTGTDEDPPQDPPETFPPTSSGSASSPDPA